MSARETSVSSMRRPFCEIRRLAAIEGLLDKFHVQRAADHRLEGRPLKQICPDIYSRNPMFLFNILDDVRHFSFASN